MTVLGHAGDDPWGAIRMGAYRRNTGATVASRAHPPKGKADSTTSLCRCSKPPPLWHLAVEARRSCAAAVRGCGCRLRRKPGYVRVNENEEYLGRDS